MVSSKINTNKMPAPEQPTPSPDIDMNRAAELARFQIHVAGSDAVDGAYKAHSLTNDTTNPFMEPVVMEATKERGGTKNTKLTTLRMARQAAFKVDANFNGPDRTNVTTLEFEGPSDDIPELVRESSVNRASSKRATEEEVFGIADSTSIWGTDSQFTETVYGKHKALAESKSRRVTRGVTSGVDNHGRSVIRVDQVSTDQEGNDIKIRSWEHSEAATDPVALRVAQGVAKRVGNQHIRPKSPSAKAREAVQEVVDRHPIVGKGLTTATKYVSRRLAEVPARRRKRIK